MICTGMSIGSNSDTLVCMMHSLGDYIRARRERLGLNQAEFARRASVPRTTINRLEKGKTNLPEADVRRKLAVALGVRHVDILEAAGELSADEIDPRLQPTYPADEVRVIAERWHQFDADERRMIIYVLNSHLQLKGDEGVDNLVRSVDERPPAFRRSVAG
jgi:transcriptional regulator with XRE-family HTH domain